VGLLLGVDLQTMLDAPKKPIRFVQFYDFIGRKKVQLMKRSQRFQHARFLQEGVARPVNELKRLHGKFDLANATRAKLDVAAEILLSHDIAFDASLDAGNLVEQIGRRTTRINERLMLPQEFVSKLAAAADSAGLDQCQPLPGFAKAAVVMLHTFQRASQRAGRAFGAEAKIDAKKRTFGITHRKRFENFFPKPVKELVIGKARRDLALMTVEKDKIDIGAVIQLAAAELPQCEYGKLGVRGAVALTQFGVPVFENCA